MSRHLLLLSGHPLQSRAQVRMPSICGGVSVIEGIRVSYDEVAALL
ncbi:hypothetical protein [Streptosporangium sp. NPDC050280]